MSQVQKSKPQFVKIDSLNPYAVGVNIVAKVIDIRMKVNRTYLDGNTLKISEATISDSTACVTLDLYNEQIKNVNVNDTLIVRNAKVQIIRGYIHLVVDQWGIIERCPAEQYEEKLNSENNISKTEYVLVPEDVNGPRPTTNAGGFYDNF